MVEILDQGDHDLTEKYGGHAAANAQVGKKKEIDEKIVESVNAHLSSAE